MLKNAADILFSKLAIARRTLRLFQNLKRPFRLQGVVHYVTDMLGSRLWNIEFSDRKETYDGNFLSAAPINKLI